MKKRLASRRFIVELLILVVLSATLVYAGLNPPIISYGYEAGAAPVYSTYITPSGGTHALVSGQSLSGYGYSYGGYVSDSDEMITYEDGVEVDRTTVGSPWSVGWDSNDAPTTAGTYMLVAEWRDRGPVDEGPHTESVSVSLFAPQDYYESNGGPEYARVTMEYGGQWENITGKNVYFAYSAQKTSALNYANFDSSRGTDTDIHKWTDSQGELLSENVADGSWAASMLSGDAVTTAGTYSVTASFQDDDNPRGTTEPEAPAIAGSNDTQGTPIAASGSIWVMAVSIAPQVQYLAVGTTKSLTATVTPDPGGTYSWSTPEDSGVRFVLEGGATSRVATGQSVVVLGYNATAVNAANLTATFTSNSDDLEREVGVSIAMNFTVWDMALLNGLTMIGNGSYVYIDDSPKMPLTSGTLTPGGLPGDVSWTLTIDYMRTDRSDSSSYSGSSAAAGYWDVQGSFGGQFRGGKATAQCVYKGGTAKRVFYIRGGNPANATADAYIDENDGVHWYASAIASVESNYDQFNNGGTLGPEWDDYQACPNRGADPGGTYGWGMMQLTNPVPTAQRLWNWHDNVQGGIELLDQCQGDATDWINNQIAQQLAQDEEALLDNEQFIFGAITYQSGTDYTPIDACTIQRYNSAGLWVIYWDNQAVQWAQQGGVYDDYVISVSNAN